MEAPGAGVQSNGFPIRNDRCRDQVFIYSPCGFNPVHTQHDIPARGIGNGDTVNCQSQLTQRNVRSDFDSDTATETTYLSRRLHKLEDAASLTSLSISLDSTWNLFSNKLGYGLPNAVFVR